MERVILISVQSPLLRFVTAGSVDDCKSTLIGRLLYETHGVYEDQLQSAAVHAHAGARLLDLARIPDGLKAEHEQAISLLLHRKTQIYYCRRSWA